MGEQSTSTVGLLHKVLLGLQYIKMLTLSAKNCDYCKGFDSSMMHVH